MFKRLLKQGFFQRKVPVRTRSAAPPEANWHCTMNDLPLPCGIWKEAHTRKNSFFNAYLGTAILSLITTISTANSMDVINWNYSIPRLD